MVKGCELKLRSLDSEGISHKSPTRSLLHVLRDRLGIGIASEAV